MQQIPFDEKELALGRDCLLQGDVKSIVFSEGTYQIEVLDEEKTFWPFLQVDDEGRVLDSFCTCSESSHCLHLAAAYLALFKGERSPLHKRFRESFWNQICQMASLRHGYRADTLVQGKRWEALSSAGEFLFSIEPLNQDGKDKIYEILEERPVETEETSLKFSNLSEEEIKLWKQGKPSNKLRYELSFWSDLAKWLFTLQEKGSSYQIEFFPKELLPNWVRISFASAVCEFTIPKEFLSDLISSLRTVESPLAVYDAEDLSIQEIRYDSQNQRFLLEFLGDKNVASPKEPVDLGVDLEDWKFIPGKGFLNKRLDPIFRKDRIEKGGIEFFLNNHTSFLKKYLNEAIHEEIYKPQYRLYFDEKFGLHIEIFLFEEGDLLAPGAALFGRWAYLPKKGFFYLQPLAFPLPKTIAPFEKVSDFIERHKTWLNGFEGFQIHLMNLEPRVSYKVDKEGSLLFISHVEVVEEETKIVDFGEWVFIPTRGFFPKKKEAMMLSIRTGKKIQKEDVPLFLRLHHEELKFLPGFFSQKSPVENMELKVSLEADGIHVAPVFTISPSYEERKILFYSEYTYVDGEGFSKIHVLQPLLVEYLEEKVLCGKEESTFIARLKEIEPWIVDSDSRLAVPKQLALRLHGMERQEESSSGQWLLELKYETDLGSVEAVDVWKAVQAGQKFLFSKAGLLDLSASRFQWLKAISKRRWSKEGKNLRLSALEWIRVQTQEFILLPEGFLEKDVRTKEIYKSFESFQGFLPLNIEGLKSTLRNYQETGLKWLWFLYCYGLSGLLCDEMGLGKTHQAMALLAGASHVKKADKKFLVVCPTSVIYHWEELLKKFLPDLKVYVFYGQSRQVDKLQDSYDILLTSYGLVRSEKKALSEIAFDIAIYDEIQNAKNASSQTHRALKGLQVSVSIGLTGTPIENRIMELRSLFDLVLPHYLPSEAQFKEQFVLPIEKEQDVQKKQLLSKLVNPFMLRRKKSEVLLELPEKVEEVSYCDLSEEQRKLYQELFFSYKSTIKEDAEKRSDKVGGGMHIFALFSKLKQVCDHPCLVTGDLDQFDQHSSGKWDLFVELLEEARGSHQKVVVFTQYLHMMDIIKLYLGQKGIGFAEIRGSTRDRREPLKRFKEDPNCEVFIASLQAAGVGIDLTAASVVIHYDRWWNPAKENQATDRVHRMGQSRGVQVFKLVTKRTVEERIHELILKKKGLLDDVVGFDDQDAIKNLTKQEIFELFSALEEDLA